MSSGAPAVSGIRRYVSVLDGVRPYRRAWLSKDVVAGVTLAALAIPETMGYTKIAGMPVITGLYTILIPIAVFAMLGSSKHLVVGADSATAAIMYAGIASLGIAGLEPATPQWVALAGLSALIAGGLLFLARIARLGFLVELPLANGADRLPHRRRRAGRDRPGRRHARHPEAVGQLELLQRRPRRRSSRRSATSAMRSGRRRSCRRRRSRSWSSSAAGSR